MPACHLLDPMKTAASSLRARSPTQEPGERLRRHIAEHGHTASPVALAAVATVSTATSLPAVAAPVRFTAR
jgi:hypothetical protein